MDDILYLQTGIFIMIFGSIIMMFVMCLNCLKSDTDTNTPAEPESQQNKQEN